MSACSIAAFMFAVLTITPMSALAQDSDPVFIYPDVFNDPERDAFLFESFPDGFSWSSATSSYQIEGGWNADGKGENIWDAFCHEAGNIVNGDTGDVACDSYNKWQKDIELMTNLNLKNYRFSISWARVLPNGTADYVNEAGVEYYNTLINDLIAAGIEPYVTIYHWDLPQALVDSYDAWLGEEIVDDFGDYARFCYETFGDRVKYWITINEPWVMSQMGYEYGMHAPGQKGHGDKTYIVSHNVIKSHAKAWHVYNDEFRSTQNGLVGITFNSDWFEPENRSDPVHLEASERMMQFQLGWHAHPIFVGDYPDVMKRRIADLSQQQGLDKSRLPEFTPAEVEYIKGTGDFFGLNHYKSQLVNNDTNDELNPPSWDKDCGVNRFVDDKWPKAATGMSVVPWGIRRLLAWMKNEYNNPPIFIIENGYSTGDIDELNDEERIKYYKSYINEALKAVNVDKVDVKLYTAWSLMDNFEWASGYTIRFGMHHVNFTDDEKSRTQKASAREYMKIVADNGFPMVSSAGSWRVGASALISGFLLKAVSLNLYGM